MDRHGDRPSGSQPGDEPPPGSQSGEPAWRYGKDQVWGPAVPMPAAHCLPGLRQLGRLEADSSGAYTLYHRAAITPAEGRPAHSFISATNKPWSGAEAWA